MKIISLQLIACLLSFISIEVRAELVDVEIWAKQFENGESIAGATVKDLYSRDQWITDSNGMIHTTMEAGREVTLAFHKPGYPVIQNGLVHVPHDGLTGYQNEITFQVPARWLYYLLKALFPDPEYGHAHVATTVSALGKNLRDDDGEAGVCIEIYDLAQGKLIENPEILYLGQVLGLSEFVLPALSQISVFKWLAREDTSHDGGILIKNLPRGHYEIRPYRPGSNDRSEFRSARFRVLENSPKFLNISPPHGPGVIKEGMNK